MSPRRILISPPARRSALAVSYNEDGVRDLVSQLADLSPAVVLLEATGGLEIPLVAEIATAGLPVVVVNPR